MKIRFLKGTTLAGGVPVNPGEVHDVGAEDAQRFVHLYRDAEFVVEAVKVEAKAETEAEAPAEIVRVSEAFEEPKNKKKKI